MVNGLVEGDFLLPSHGGYFGKLLKYKAFEKQDGAIKAVFDVAKTFSSELLLLEISCAVSTFRRILIC